MAVKDPQNTLVYGDKEGNAYLEFYHHGLKDIPSKLRDEFQEAVTRFGSLLVENIEHMDKYKVEGYPQLSGIINTIQKLREANEKEDEMSDTY